MASKKKSGSGSFLQRGKMIFAVLGVLGIAVFVGLLTLLQQLYQTETYYVLKDDVATRTQVSPDMMTAVTTSKDTAPKAAKSISDVQSGSLYTKYPLTKGDILTNSNVGPFEDISTGVPDNWVITSFPVSADNAVQGRIKRGFYFDMMVVDTNKGSTYPFINVLTLDTSVSLSNASSNNAADTAEAKAGQTSVYTVGMPPQDAAKLQWIIKKYGGSVQLLLSPRQNEYAAPQIVSYTGTFSYKPDESPKNMGEGTDSTFSATQRDSFGRPVAKAENCSQGNAKLDEKTCAKASAQASSQPSASSSPSPSSSK